MNYDWKKTEEFDYIKQNYCAFVLKTTDFQEVRNSSKFNDYVS